MYNCITISHFCKVFFKKGLLDAFFSAILKNMKKVFLFVSILILFFNLSAWAGNIQDVKLSTSDGQCSFHYLTNKDISNLFIKYIEGQCIDGFISGPAYIVIQDHKTEKMEQINAFFIQGYPFESLFRQVPLKKLTLSNKEEQHMTFDLGTDTTGQISFIGRATAIRLTDNTYGPFTLCNPFWMLIKTDYPDLFSDETVQQNLISDAINKTKSVCPEIQKIRLYGSHTENPENKDISFFADIDLSQKSIKVKRIPSSSRVRDILNNPDISIPLPKTIKHENSTPVMTVTPVKSEVKQIVSAQSEQVKTETKTTKLPVKQPETAKSSKARIQENKLIVLDEIPHLLTTARLLKQPIQGKVLIHISELLSDNQVIVDLPTPLRAEGENLSVGWGIAEGTFSYIGTGNNPDEVQGFLLIQSFTPKK